MAAEPLPAGPIFTRAEVLCSVYVARALWVLSAALLASLAAWSAGPAWAT
jgi:hypothetical protein